MLVQSFFDQLTYGELAQVEIGGIETTGIVPEVYPNVVSQINLGLTALAKRFPIRVKSVDIQENSSVNLYILSSTYSIQTATAPNDYLIDTVSDTFSDDVLKMEYITYVDSDNQTQRVAFNVLDDEDAVIKREYNSFYVNTTEDRLLTVYYRAKLSELNADTLDPETDVIDLPPVFIEPLLYYVASRLHANRPTIDGQENTSLKYMQMYEKALLDIKDDGLFEETDFVNYKLDTNGWV